MKKSILLIFALSVSFISAQNLIVNNSNKDELWSPVGDKIKTEWASKITPDNVWSDYPRPQMVRSNWKNLNGLWDYTILHRMPRERVAPIKYRGKILVPFSIESSLSGVGKELLPVEILWYRKRFDVSEWKDKDVILHFGAVDYRSTLYINGQEVGTHVGGNDPFSYNITPFLNGEKKLQELELSVWDPTDTGTQPRGKQTLRPRGIWYSAVSGIWQTVWLEAVEKTHINQININSDIDHRKIKIDLGLKNSEGNEKFSIKISQGGAPIVNQIFDSNQHLNIEIPNPKLWSPNQPHLYDVEVNVTRNGVSIDKISSYFAMRKIALGKDKNGFTKLFLNNQELFHFGTLDQGWWPDGLLTPPSRDAMVYDMKVLKDLGFNTIRKHLKVEPAIFYYEADKLGFLLWQDMPSGFLHNHHPDQHVRPGDKDDWDRPSETAKLFKEEWKNIIDHLKFFSSVVVWVPFNEGMGQFQSREITKWTMKYDPTRLVNGISGWQDRGVGHFIDLHQYPGPGMEPPSQNEGRAVVLGEFGGYGLPVENHMWNQSKKNWGYRVSETLESYIKDYNEVIYNLHGERARGLAAAIYTQTSDVEIEVNGILTYDRKVIKLPIKATKTIHDNLFDDYKKADFIFRDSEINKMSKKITYQSLPLNWVLKPKKFKQLKLKEFPVPLKIGKAAFSFKEFRLDRIPKHLSLKFYGNGDVTIFINGQKVLDKYLRTKRHYDDINLSDYLHTLKKGINNISFQIDNPTEDGQFDYGLYTY